MLRKRLLTCLLGSLLAAAVGAAFASPASAGTYIVNSCGNAGNPGPQWDWEATGGPNDYSTYFWTLNGCGGSAGLVRHFEPVTIPAGAYFAWKFHAPAGTYIQSTHLVQQIKYRAPGAYDSIIAERADGSRALVSSLVGTGDVNAIQGDKTYDMPASGSPTTTFRAEMGCQTVNNCYGNYGGWPGDEWTIWAAATTLSDPSNPSFTAVGGTGWQAAPADGTDTITYSVADAGSGVSEVRYYVDGILNASNLSSCTPGVGVPCPLTTSGQFLLDTTRLSEGSHTISLVSLDWSANATTQADKQLTITVRRPPHATTSAPVTTSDPSSNGGGSPAVGDHLGGNAGGWSGEGNTYTYQWQRCDAEGLDCVAIDGATGLGYTPTSADVGYTLVFCVTATNSGGSATSCSAPTPPVVASHSSPASTSDRPGETAAPLPGGGSPAGGSTGTSSPAHGAANGSPAAERVVLTAVTNNRSSTQKVKFGKRVPISGRLVGPDGSPIAGATLSVQVQTAVPGAAMADSAQVVTGRDGRFTYVAPAGPSRVIRFGYRTYTSDTAFADTTDVRLLVSAGVTMKATPTRVHNRHATMFTGRLLGKPLAKRGVVVDLQVFFRKQWRTFAAPRTNKQGAYRFKYRFMAGAATWKFRARVRRVLEYPYELGYSSKRVKVRVLP
jgi:hypothetical protein